MSLETQVRAILESWSRETLVDVIVKEMPDEEKLQFIAEQGEPEELSDEELEQRDNNKG